MSRISELPVELLQHIFSLSIPATTGSEWPLIIPVLEPHPTICSIDSNPRRRHLSIALAISYVCRQWRNIALSVGELWSRVIIQLFDRSPLETSIVEWQLRLAGTCPLDLESDLSRTRNFLLDWIVSPGSLELIQSLLPQCQSLRIPPISQELYSRIFPLHRQLPILKRIYIRIYLASGGKVKPPDPIFQNPAVAPALEGLHFWFIDYDRLNLVENIDLSLLKELSMGPLRVHLFPEFFSLLKECTSLTHLIFPLNWNQDFEVYPLHPIELPRLESLLRMDSSNVPPIRSLTMLIPNLVFNMRQEWSPPMWMQNVELLSFPTNWFSPPTRAIRSALCARSSGHGSYAQSELVALWTHFAKLKTLTIYMKLSELGSRGTHSMVQDLVAILDFRTDLRVQVQQKLINQGGETWDELSTRYGDRLVAVDERIEYW
ncbi:hypothetical protein DL93DRAFT_1213119 [Clavulina sp. PMI_390]|nr:hypothetical protein DL93DRAFT_1213119 [Clavulina sp. PMI_390]